MLDRKRWMFDGMTKILGSTFGYMIKDIDNVRCTLQNPTIRLNIQNRIGCVDNGLTLKQMLSQQWNIGFRLCRVVAVKLGEQLSSENNDIDRRKRVNAVEAARRE